MQLHVTDDGEPLSLYKLCRKWVHNDPDLDSQTVPEVVSKMTWHVQREAYRIRGGGSVLGPS